MCVLLPCVQRSDLAVGSMTINSAREKVIDFTKPFRNLGISILFKVCFLPLTVQLTMQTMLALQYNPIYCTQVLFQIQMVLIKSAIFCYQTK